MLHPQAPYDTPSSVVGHTEGLLDDLELVLRVAPLPAAGLANTVDTRPLYSVFLKYNESYTVFGKHFKIVTPDKTNPHVQCTAGEAIPEALGRI